MVELGPNFGYSNVNLWSLVTPVGESISLALPRRGHPSTLPDPCREHRCPELHSWRGKLTEAATNQVPRNLVVWVCLVALFPGWLVISLLKDIHGEACGSQKVCGTGDCHWGGLHRLGNSPTIILVNSFSIHLRSFEVSTWCELRFYGFVLCLVSIQTSVMTCKTMPARQPRVFHASI